MIFVAFIVILCVFALIIEGTHTLVFGWIVPEKELEVYLSKYLPIAGLNPYSHSRDLFCDIPQYIAKSNTFLFKWYIRDYGVVPRWSKWSKAIDKRQAELLAVNPVKALADL